MALVLIIAIGLASFYFSPFGRHIRYYGEAEDIVNEFILPFRNDLADQATTIESLLESPEYAELDQRVMKNVELENDEMVRFTINEMFDVGVMKDGGIHWHVKQ